MKKLMFFVRRLLQGVATLLVIAVINFVLIRMAPGDPAMVMAGEAGSGDELFLQQLRERFDLDRPLPEQLASYLAHLMHGDLGESYRQQQPVLDLILEPRCCSLAQRWSSHWCWGSLWVSGLARAWEPGKTALFPHWPHCSMPRPCTGWHWWPYLCSRCGYRGFRRMAKQPLAPATPGWRTCLTLRTT